MKARILKAVNAACYYVANFIAGFAIGRAIGAIFSKFLTEELAEEHPWLFVGLYSLYIALVTAAAIGFAVINPLYKLYEFFDNKIDGNNEEKDLFDI